MASHADASAPEEGVVAWFTRSGLLSFHVPVFYIVSGFLYGVSGARSVSTVLRRWQRLLVPYVVASIAALVLVRLPRGAPSLETVGVWLVSGGTLGVYYYVFKQALLIPVAWLLARLDRRTVALLLAAVTAWTMVVAFRPDLDWYASWYWMMRNPLRSFTVGYFLLGWTVAAYRAELGALLARYPTAVRAALGSLLVVSALATIDLLPDRRPLGRMAYTLGVAGLLACVRWTKVPAAVRFLSETSLSIYLAHRILQILLQPLPAGWSATSQIAASFTVGLVGSLALARLARAQLGATRARFWLGA